MEQEDHMAGETFALGKLDSPVPANGVSNRQVRRILDRIGWRRTCSIVWRATPWPWKPIAFAYNLSVYRRLFAASDTLHYLHAMHSAQYDASWLFRLVRPRYHKVERYLRRFGVAGEE
jgi:hypothetical protein